MARVRRPEERGTPPKATESTVVVDTAFYGQELIGEEEIADAAPDAAVEAARAELAALPEEIVRDAMELAEFEEEKVSVVIVLADPQGKMYLLHRTADGRMRFPSDTAPKRRFLSARDLETFANEILFAHAGISVPHWEAFARDEGTDTVYVRAYHRNIFDAAVVCRNSVGSMHVSSIDSILGGLAGVNKHVRWITAVAAHAPMMEYLLFKCPVA